MNVIQETDGTFTIKNIKLNSQWKQSSTGKSITMLYEKAKHDGKTFQLAIYQVMRGQSREE